MNLRTRPSSSPTIALVIMSLLAAHASAQNYESYYLFQGGHPIGETNWSDDVQGVAHDANNWFITNTDQIWKIPVTLNLNTVTATSPGVIRRFLSSYPQIPLFDHLGDPDVFTFGGMDYLIVPLEQHDADCVNGQQGSVAIFRITLTDLIYVDHAMLPGQCNDAGWVAVRSDGHLFSSRQRVGVENPDQRGLREYSLDWPALQATGIANITFVQNIPMFTEIGWPLSLRTMQGGEFAPGDGLLYLVSGFYDDDNGREEEEGIHVIETSTYFRVQHSTRGFGHFDYYYDPGFNTYEEPEGLTIWDLEDGRAPGIRGQLHVFVSDNDAPLIDSGDVDFKHYTNIIRVNATSTCQSGTIACPFRTIAGAMNLAWNGAEVRVNAGSFDEQLVLSKRVRLSAQNGIVRIGG